MDARSGVVISLGSILQQGSQFLFAILVARALGPSEYGWFAIGRNAFAWAATLAPLGLDLAMIRYASQFGGQRSFWGILSRLRGIVVLVSLATIAVILALSSTALSFETGALLVLAASLAALPFAADASILGGYYRGRHHPLLFSLIFDYGQSIARVLVGFALFLSAAGVIAFTLGNGAIAAAGALAVAVVAFGIRPRAPEEGAGTTVRAILGVSPWLAFSMVCYGLFRILDLAVLGAHVSSEEVGRYAAVAAVCVFVQVYPTTLAQALGPEIAALSVRAGLQAAGPSVRAFVARASLVGAYVYGGIAIFGTHLNLFFGEKFHVDPMVLLMMATAWLISGILNPTGLALSMTGRHRRESALILMGAIVFAGALLLLVPPFGTYGAAISLLVVMIAVQAGRTVLVSAVIEGPIGTLWDFVPPLLALGFAKVIDLGVSQYLGVNFVSFFVGCVIYTAAYGAAALAFRKWRSPAPRDAA